MQNNFSLDSAASECSGDRRRKLRRIARVAEWISLGGMALVGTYSAYMWSDQAALTAICREAFQESSACLPADH
jgi:adenylylsulfate kinase-like enzyme